MAVVKNPVLLTLGKILGLSPGKGTPLVLDERNLSLTLPIVPDVARRGGSGIQAGWYLGVLENVHSGADAESSNIDPYNPGASAVAPYPSVVDPGFDVWLLGVAGIRTSAAGDLLGALMTMNPGDSSQGWGEDDADVPLLATPSLRLAHFNSVLDTVLTTVAHPMLTPAGQTWVPLNLRVPRGGIIGFSTQSAAAAEYQAQFLIGLFPAGLGQDVTS